MEGGVGEDLPGRGGDGALQTKIHTKVNNLSFLMYLL